MKPYDIVEAFEKRVAEYTGAKYGVAVNSCTNALFLSCLYFNVDEVILPAHTYVGVAQSVINAGGKVKFKDYEWQGWYQLQPYWIIDSARRFRRNMYNEFGHDNLICLSFHWFKHIPIGQGGMILTNKERDVKWFKGARFDGRTEGVPAKEDTFQVPGYHCYMTPEQAARGLMFMENVKDEYEDLPETEYPDLSLQECFK